VVLASQLSGVVDVFLVDCKKMDVESDAVLLAGQEVRMQAMFFLLEEPQRDVTDLG
jgi:hypothetical protein